MNENSDKIKQAIITYFRGVRTEWGKITWPEKNQVVVETCFVVAIVFIFTVFVYVVDIILNASNAVEASDIEEKKSSEKSQKRWYIVHTYSGYENKVKSNLEKRIEYMNMADKRFRVEVPQKTVTQIKGGRKLEKEEK